MPQQGRRKANQVLLIALACGATVEVAANKAGVSPATVYRRLQDPKFQKELQQLRSDMVQRTAGMLTAAGGEAVKSLVALLKDTGPAGAWGQPARSSSWRSRCARRPNWSHALPPWSRNPTAGENLEMPAPPAYVSSCASGSIRPSKPAAWLRGSRRSRGA
jgi:hypothetical protein